ncbi:uncharacterized protein LOC124779368 [Schistocerca piceifrons]|uniref:uncharacterized protein LOC124779368 n=1 Tax=Schistocerca piceifrons TaxID=274613 RepID=UPI001F5E3D1C|nr:uncharacterized protein LOC124779368 [Schistocerca piceifrons]
MPTRIFCRKICNIIKLEYEVAPSPPAPAMEVAAEPEAEGGGGSGGGGDSGGGEGVCRTVDKPRDPDRSRDLFGVQLEVTSLLLEAERRKLWVLQRELQTALAEGGSIKAKEHQRQELLLAISRIQAQHDHLEKEYEQHAIGVLRCSNTRGSGKSNRSQPAIGLKQTPKARPTIFGTVASDQTPKDGSSRRVSCSYCKGFASVCKYFNTFR